MKKNRSGQATFPLAALITLFVMSSVQAGPVVDRTVERGYLLSLPFRKGAEFRRMGLVVALPGMGMTAKLERDNWAFACEKNGFALLNLEVDYADIQHEAHIDALHERIQALVNEVISANPAIDRENVFIAGTSRGGMAAIALALRHPGRYRGVGVAAGAALGMGAEDQAGNAAGQHFYFAHGDRDKIVPMTYFNKTVRRLSNDGAIVQTFVKRGGGHNLDKTSYSHLVRWMAFRMGKRSEKVPQTAPK